MRTHFISQNELTVLRKDGMQCGIDGLGMFLELPVACALNNAFAYLSRTYYEGEDNENYWLEEPDRRAHVVHLARLYRILLTDDPVRQSDLTRDFLIFCQCKLGDEENIGQIHDIFVAIVQEATGDVGYEGEFWLRQQAQPMYRMVRRWEEAGGELICGEDWKVDHVWMADKMEEILHPYDGGPLEGFWNNLIECADHGWPSLPVSREAAQAALDYFWEKMGSFEEDFLARVGKRMAARKIMRCKQRMFPILGALHHHMNRPDGPIAKREAGKYPAEAPERVVT
jgi:hypothetical protein